MNKLDQQLTQAIHALIPELKCTVKKSTHWLSHDCSEEKPLELRHVLWALNVKYSRGTDTHMVFSLWGDTNLMINIHINPEEKISLLYHLPQSLYKQNEILRTNLLDLLNGE